MYQGSGAVASVAAVERVSVPVEPDYKVATRDEVLAWATDKCVTHLRNNRQGLPPLPVAARWMVRDTNAALAAWTKARGIKRDEAITGLLARQAAVLLMVYHQVALIPAIETDADRSVALLAVYDAAEGLYLECSGRSNHLTVALRELSFDASSKWIDEVLGALRDLAPLRYQTADEDLVALDDCVYNRRTGEREAYDPAKHVFLAKVRTRLPETEPELPRIQNPDGTWWDPWSWLVETMGSEVMARSIIEVLAYVLCPRAFSDDKVVIFLADSGSNGKGTVLAFYRAIVGGPKGIGCTSLGLEVFGGGGSGSKEFLLTRLIGAMANLSDESEGDEFMSASAKLKKISSHDPIQINRKHRDPIEVKLFVSMVFSLNRLPRIKDKSGAIDRRLHIMEFGQRFMSEGTEIKKNPRIKSDYVLRDDVREWFVWQALVAIGPITELSVPEEVDAALEEHRGTNDPVIEFWRAHADALEASSLTHLPLDMLYDAYAAWSRSKRGSGATVEGDRAVKQRLAEEATRGGVWADKRTSRGERTQLSLLGWSGSHSARAVREVFGTLGLSSVRPGGDFTVPQEIIAEDRKLARWTRDIMPANTLLAAGALPARGACLTRDSAPAPAPVPPITSPVSPTSQPAQAPAPAATGTPGSGGWGGVGICPPTDDTPAPGWGGEGITPPAAAVNATTEGDN